MTSGTTGWPEGLWGSSANDVFAVGMSGTILHYVPSPLYVSSTGNCDGKTPCYKTIQAALAAAEDGKTIKVRGGAYPESPAWNVSGTVTLSGGWNETFSNQTGTTEIYAPSATSGGCLKVRANTRMVPKR